MYYILDPEVGLRSWQRVPHAVYYRSRSDAVGLTGEEFERLLLADGRHDLPEDAVLRRLAARGLVRACGKEEFSLSDWNQYQHFDNRYMPKMNWQITGRCNYNCRHCFNAADNLPLQSEFTLAEALRLLDEARDCGIHGITLTGGEPLLHPHILEILQAIHDRGMLLFDLNTNGFFVDQAFLDELKRLDCRPQIKISFDGVGCHDWMRDFPGAEADALRAIRLCVENGFPVMAQVNLNRKNRGCMAETLALLDALGVQASRIIRTTEAPRWQENAPGESLETEEYYGAVLDVLEQYIARPRRMKVLAWQFVRLYPEQKTFALEPVTAFGQKRFRPSQPICKGARGMIAVAANGNVYPCLQMSGALEAMGREYGNAKIQGLKSLLQDSAYLRCVCQTVQDRLDRNEKCHTCPYLTDCAGGCPAAAMLNPENPMEMLGIDSWKCLFFENRWWERLERRLTGYRNLTPIIPA